LPEDRRVLRVSGTLHSPDPGSRPPVRPPRHLHAGRARDVGRRRGEVGGRRVPPDLRQAQARMTVLGDGAGSTTRAATQPAARGRSTRAWWHTNTGRRLTFGYLLLAAAPSGKWMYDSPFSLLDWFLH